MSDRLERALVQKLYFIEEIIVDDTTRNYLIMGSTGNVYTVTISKSSKCTCPDYIKRKAKCKHIFFVLMKVLKVNPTLKKENLVNAFKKDLVIDNKIILPKDKKDKYESIINSTAPNECDRKLDNDICPICLDDIIDLKLAYYCKKSCGKNVHIECFNIFRPIFNKYWRFKMHFS